MSGNRLWWICLHNEMCGPISDDSLTTLIKHQRLGGNDFVWREGWNSWLTLANTVEYSAYFPKLPTIAIPKATPNPPPTKSSVVHTPIEKGPVSRSERIPITGWVRFETGDSYQAINISETGLLVAISGDVALLGREVKFRLECPPLGRALDMTGILVREDISTSATNTAVAIEFTKVNPAYRRLIKEYVNANTQKKAA